MLTFLQETYQLVEDLHIESKETEHFRQLLQSLGFPTMTKRQEELYDPYPTTFEWMFERQFPEEQPDNGFFTWLETRGGIYWVNGKPGSGKSTVR